MTISHFCCGRKLLKFPSFHLWTRVAWHRQESDRRPAWVWSGELCCLLQPFSDQRETSVCLQGEAGAEKELELERELPGCPHAAPDHCLFPRDGGDRLCPQKGQSCKKAHRVPPVMTSLLPMAEVLTAPKLQDLVSCQPQGQSQPDVCGQFSLSQGTAGGKQGPTGEPHRTQGDTAGHVPLPLPLARNGMLEALELCGHFGELTYNFRSASVPFGEELVFPWLKQWVLNVITGLKTCSGAELMIYKQRLHFQSVYKVLLALLNPFFAEYKWWLGYSFHGVHAWSRGMVTSGDRLGNCWIYSSRRRHKKWFWFSPFLCPSWQNPQSYCSRRKSPNKLLADCYLSSWKSLLYPRTLVLPKGYLSSGPCTIRLKKTITKINPDTWQINETL